MKISYSDGNILPEEIIKQLGFTGRLFMVIEETIKNKTVFEKAGEFGISVSDEELQNFADNFRCLLGLYSAGDMNKFLENSGLTVGDFEVWCETSIMTNHIKNHLANEKRIEEYFINNRNDFDLARISSITVEEENLAKDLIMQVEEDGEDFHMLARKHSTDDTSRYAGGYIGLISRKMLSPEISAKVFNASEGELVGPFAQDKSYQLLLIEEVLKAELNEKIKSEIKDILFYDWLSPIFREGINITAD